MATQEEDGLDMSVVGNNAFNLWLIPITCSVHMSYVLFDVLTEEKLEEENIYKIKTKKSNRID